MNLPNHRPLTDDEIAVRIAATTARRLFLSAHHPHCSRCVARQLAKDPSVDVDAISLTSPTQVQLTDYIDYSPARWRCRLCGYRFRWEPEAVEKYSQNQ